MLDEAPDTAGMELALAEAERAAAPRERWLVLWYDGNYRRGAYVAAREGTMPFGAGDALRELLQRDAPDFQLDAIVGPLPPGWDENVVVDDEEAVVEEMELP